MNKMTVTKVRTGQENTNPAFVADVVEHIHYKMLNVSKDK